MNLLIKIKECDLKISITQLNETDVTNELLKSAKNQISNEFENFGLDIEIKSIKNPEAFVEHYYRERGYSVAKTDFNKIHEIVRDQMNDGLGEELLKQGVGTGLPDDRIRTDFGVGCPDFLVWKFNQNRQVELFFVEAKSEMHGLSFNQIRWIAKHPKVRTKIMWAMDSSHTEHRRMAA